MGFFLWVFHWILNTQGYTLLHHALLALYLGAYFGVFGWAYNFVFRRRGPIWAAVSAPVFWVALEYIRSNLSFLALPWALLGHSQYEFPAVIQIASVVGTYGISFLIVLVNAALALVVGELWARRKGRGGRTAGAGAPLSLPRPPGRARGVWAVCGVTAALVAITLGYGHWKLSQPMEGPEITVALAQGNIEQSKKWDPQYAREIMDAYRSLTEEAARAKPDLIVWPETATPGAVTRTPALLDEMRQMADRAGVPLLFGSAQHFKFQGEKEARIKYSNSAFLLHPGQASSEMQQYDKIRLFPFGEYLPYREIIPWSAIGVSQGGDYLTGDDFTLFQTAGVRFGATICWENVFPDLVRQFVLRGAQFIVNLTNEARFGESAAPYQLAAISVFRAVENGVYFLRGNNVVPGTSLEGVDSPGHGCGDSYLVKEEFTVTVKKLPKN